MAKQNIFTFQLFLSEYGVSRNHSQAYGCIVYVLWVDHLDSLWNSVDCGRIRDFDKLIDFAIDVEGFET